MDMRTVAMLKNVNVEVCAGSDGSITFRMKPITKFPSIKGSKSRCGLTEESYQRLKNTIAAAEEFEQLVEYTKQ